MIATTEFRLAIANNDIEKARSLVGDLINIPKADTESEYNDLYDLVNFAVKKGRVEILEALVSGFKHLSTNGRRLAKYCLYTSFHSGQMECAQSLQHFFPSEVFFCLPSATQNDHVHMLEHFLPPFNPDSTDVTRLLIVAWQYDSPQCFDYLLPQCTEVDTDEVARRFGARKEGVEFTAHVAARRQKLVLLCEVAEDGRPRNRKM